ncbi:MAG: alginate lyase family protein [Ferruginibacter sp.]
MIIRTLFLFAVCLLCKAVVNGHASQPPVVYSLDAKVLENNKIKLRKKDIGLLPAYEQLLKEAAQALAYEPVSVMEKADVPPSGDKHDYMSIAPYFWPDSSKPNGVPYMNRDGLVNPEVKQYKDKIYLAEICDAVSTLALAWYFSGDERYAAHAAKLMRVWFLNPETKMNPNLNFAQAIKGKTTGRGYGLIDTRHFVKLIDAIGLLNGAANWLPADQAGMQGWFTSFLDWMHTSKNGIDEMNTANNHAVWYDLQRLSIALFVGKKELAKQIVASATGRLDKQMDEQGSFPLEMKRTISLHYTVFVLDPFFTIAQLSQHTDFDFWNYESPTGKSLKKGFNVLVPYLLGEKKWEGPQILSFKFEEAIPLLIEGAKHYSCTGCRQQVNKLLGEEASNSRYHLLTDF